MNFPYVATVTTEESLEVENIGNCVIDAFNSLGFEWILIIYTTMGSTQVIEYGPICADLENYLPASVSYTYTRMDFSEVKLKKKITNFLNDTYRNIIQAFEITLEEAKSKIKNMVEYIENGD